MSSRRKGNRPFPVAGFFAYLDAEPRSVSITPIEPPQAVAIFRAVYVLPEPVGPASARRALADRKSTRLNSSHANISYAVFCLKKKKKSLELNTTNNSE